MSKGFQISPTGLTDTMYLFRATICTYFTRNCFSKELKTEASPLTLKYQFFSFDLFCEINVIKAITIDFYQVATTR